MRVVIQRVREARVTIASEVVGEIGPGLLVLLGVQNGDTAADAEWLVDKTVSLRIFPDSAGKLNLSVRDTSGGLLIVSQFTLIASTRKGARPSFNDAARPDVAVPLYEKFIALAAQAISREVSHGRFGADMQVALVNDGPVTLILDSHSRE